jgi:hypothetical protein
MAQKNFYHKNVVFLSRQRRYEPSVIFATVQLMTPDDAVSDVGTSANKLVALQREWGHSVQPLI